MLSQPPSPRARPFQEHVVPAILGPCAERLVAAAALQPGERVLDVACGSGAATRAAARAVGRDGRVVGVDIDADMIAVAASVPSDGEIEWRRGDAIALPLDDASFDVVVCAQGLQFFPDPALGLREMQRVLVPGGRVAVAVWGPPDSNPYFHALHRGLYPHLDADTVATMKRPFSLGDTAELRRLFEATHYALVEVESVVLPLDLPPLDEFVPRHLGAVPTADAIARVSPAAIAAMIDRMCADLRGPVPFTLRIARAVRQG